MRDIATATVSGNLTRDVELVGGRHLLLIDCILLLVHIVDAQAGRADVEVPTGERDPSRLGDRAGFVGLVFHVTESEPQR